MAANLMTAKFGPGVTVINAFLFIGLDLTSRDKLHEFWSGRGLVRKMGLLIIAGSVLSWILNRDTGQIAVASFLAFACSAAVDTVIYTALHDKSWMVKVNGSNAIGALVDSIVFPTIAFGSILPWIMLGQFLAKLSGGFIWAFVLNRKADERAGRK